MSAASSARQLPVAGCRLPTRQPGTDNRQRPDLLRVEFDDELFLDRQTDVFALRKIRDRAAELLGLELEPCRNAASRRRFDGLADLIVLAALFPDLNDVALAHLVRRD